MDMGKSGEGAEGAIDELILWWASTGVAKPSPATGIQIRTQIACIRVLNFGVFDFARQEGKGREGNEWAYLPVAGHRRRARRRLGQGRRSSPCRRRRRR